jgi:hypothetical protein
VAPCRIVKGRRRLAAYLTDLSLRGGRVHCDVEPPRTGAAVSIELRLGRAFSHVRMAAAVKWVRAAARGGHNFGFTFGRLGPVERTALEGALHDFRRRAADIA